MPGPMDVPKRAGSNMLKFTFTVIFGKQSMHVRFAPALVFREKEIQNLIKLWIRGNHFFLHFHFRSFFKGDISISLSHNQKFKLSRNQRV
jgi:hypothetical protein